MKMQNMFNVSGKTLRRHAGAWFFCCVWAGAAAGSSPGADLSRLVVVGDSLSAGVENFSLLDRQQPHGYAAVIAAQAGVRLVLPLVPYPGAPNVLTLVSPGPPPVIAPVPGTLPFPPRDNPQIQATNLSVPGVTVADALLAPAEIPPSQGPVSSWAEIVLGFPGPPQSQVQEALELNPTTLIVWLGNNDILVPALTGQLSEVTPVDAFTGSYTQVLTTLAASGATLITANIPDVTEVPYFTPVPVFARQVGLPVDTVTAVLGIQSGDYLRTSAIPIATILLQGGTVPPPYSWPGNCPLPVPGLLPPGVPLPCVLTASDAASIQSTTVAYNSAITGVAGSLGATVVDINSLVTEIHQNGYVAGDFCLNTGFLGGLFSLDGVHPTNTGYAIVANRFIDTMNGDLGTAIPDVDVAHVAANDPLVFPRSHCLSNGSGGPTP